MNRRRFATTAILAGGLLWLPGTAEEEEKREPRRFFKGVELYSWRGDEGEWRFALLEGTNRIKTEAEIKGYKKQVKGVEAAAKAIAKLAVDEEVSWIHRGGGFAFPPAEVRKEIADAAEKAQVKLHIVMKRG